MQKNPITIGTAERKILIVLLYYITLGVFTFTSFTLFTKHIDQNAIATIEYFECEKSGRNNTCSYDVQQTPYVSFITFLLIGLFPGINLVFAVNVQELKAFVKKLNTTVLKKATLSTIEDRSKSTGDHTLPRK